MGSLTIIYMILRRRNVRLALLHNRLIMGMSINDVLKSLAIGVNIAAAPNEYNTVDHFFPSHGNDATCTAQGFFIIFGLSVPLYCTCLCIYYLLVIRFNIRESILTQKYEKFVHLISFILPLTLAIWAVTMNLIQSYGLVWCFVVPGRYEKYNQVNLEDYDFDTARKFRMTLSCLLITMPIIIITSMGAIYYTVFQQEQTMERYDFRAQIPTLNQTTHRHMTVRNENENETNQPHAAATATNNNVITPTTNRGNNAGRGGGNGGVHESKQETAIQAFLYTGAYLTTFLIVGIARLRDNDVGFAYILVIVIFFPLQGFWNFFAFVRPKYIALRKKNQTKSCTWIWRAAIFSSLEEEERKNIRSGVLRTNQRFSISLPVQTQQPLSLPSSSDNDSGGDDVVSLGEICDVISSQHLISNEECKDDAVSIPQSDVE